MGVPTSPVLASKTAPKPPPRDTGKTRHSLFVKFQPLSLKTHPATTVLQCLSLWPNADSFLQITVERPSAVVTKETPVSSPPILSLGESPNNAGISDSPRLRQLKTRAQLCPTDPNVCLLVSDSVMRLTFSLPDVAVLPTGLSCSPACHIGEAAALSHDSTPLIRTSLTRPQTGSLETRNIRHKPSPNFNQPRTQRALANDNTLRLS
jgi:hypothetical protein